MRGTKAQFWAYQRPLGLLLGDRRPVFAVSPEGGMEIHFENYAKATVCKWDCVRLSPQEAVELAAWALNTFLVPLENEKKEAEGEGIPDPESDS